MLQVVHPEEKPPLVVRLEQRRRAHPHQMGRHRLQAAKVLARQQVGRQFTRRLGEQFRLGGVERCVVDIFDQLAAKGRDAGSEVGGSPSRGGSHGTNRHGTGHLSNHGILPFEESIERKSFKSFTVSIADD
jgi:hypothetical protein